MPSVDGGQQPLQQFQNLAHGSALRSRHLSLQRPIDGFPSQTDEPGDGRDRLAVSVQLPDECFFFFGEPDSGAGLAATPRPAIGFGFGDPGKLPFFADLGFVGRNARQHPGH